jgi:predicted transcriptional regulator
VFHAAVPRERLVEQGLAELADQFCDGTATPLVLALVQGHRFSSKDIDRFRKLLDELEEKQPRQTKRRSGRRRK